MTFFNDFINRKIKKTFVKQLKVKLEYHTKTILGKLLGRKKEEQLANAYTVLVQKSEKDIKIF